MTPEMLTTLAIEPALMLLPPKMDSYLARRFLIAIAVQESNLKHRRQVRGPARGWWQFETAGVQGVLNHTTSKDHAREALRAIHIRTYELTAFQVKQSLEYCDAAAGVFARLLMWTLPQRLPRSEDKAWDQYIDAWRPGKPHRARWARSWRIATEAMG